MYYNSMKKIRIEKGITLSKLSKSTGISIGYLCHLEQGSRRNPSIEVMDKIAYSLGKSVSEVFFK